jgi:hypothetical protein
MGAVARLRMIRPSSASGRARQVGAAATSAFADWGLRFSVRSAEAPATLHVQLDSLVAVGLLKVGAKLSKHKPGSLGLPGLGGEGVMKGEAPFLSQERAACPPAGGGGGGAQGVPGLALHAGGSSASPNPGRIGGGGGVGAFTARGGAAAATAAGAAAAAASAGGSGLVEANVMMLGGGGGRVSSPGAGAGPDARPLRPLQRPMTSMSRLSKGGGGMAGRLRAHVASPLSLGVRSASATATVLDLDAGNDATAPAASATFR